MNRFLICLVVAHCVLGEVVTNANLRGQGAATDAAALNAGNEAIHNQHDQMKKHENSLNEVLKKIREEGLKNGAKVTKDTVLSVPDVSYQNYLVMRQRINKDCNAPVASLIARNAGCIRYGKDSSMQVICTSSNSYDSYYYYSSTNCTGVVGYSYSSNFGEPSCNEGQGMQCVSQYDLPEFAEKEGLYTYKFRDQNTCSSYAANVLGFWPNYNDDGVLFDDYFPQYDDNSGNFDDDSTPCCMPNELLPPPNVGVADVCPYPVCEINNEGGGEGGEGGNVPVRRQLSDKAIKPIHTAPAFVRPAQWWKSKAKTAAVKNAMKLQTIPTDAYYREYSLAQQRSNVCVFDEKYKLWVKTSCHGQRDTLVYHIYADDQCHALIKKVEHYLSDAIPHYGECVASAKGDNRVALTICHNKSGVTPPTYNSGGES
eukprot:gene7486-8980_t